MPDYDKIGREVRAIFTAYPVEPETEEDKMVADLRYPGWREKGIPPCVPTAESVETWGRLWWRSTGEGDDADDVDIVEVRYVGFVCGPLKYYARGTSFLMGDDVEDDSFWAGPVLERPVKRGERP